MVKQTISEKWLMKKLSEVCPLQRGFDLPSSALIDGSTPVVYSNGIHKYHSEYKVCAPGVVTGRSGTIGKVHYIDKNYWPHNTTLWVTDFCGNYPKYIYYLLVYLKLDQFCAGSGVPTLNRNDVHSQIIGVPPLPEQQKIAEILSTWDEAIDKLGRLIELKEKYFKNQLKFFTKEDFNDDLRNKKLKELALIKKGAQLNKNNLSEKNAYPALNGGIEPSGYTEIWNTKENTIAISEGGNSCGYVNFMTEKFWSGGHCYTLLDISKEIENKYLYYFLKVNEKKIMDLRVGSGLPNIQRNSLENFLVTYPTIERQKRFVLIFDAFYSELTALKSIKQFLQKQKQGLMQKLLTGKLRVKI